MAVQDCDKISNIVAIELLAGNDELSKEIAELAATKNYAQTAAAKLGEGERDLAGRSVNTLELMAKSAEIKIDAIVQSHILKGQAGEEALMELAKQIDNTKESLYGGMRLLDMVRGGSDVDIKEIARLWNDTLDTSVAMKQMEDAIADYVAADYSIYRAYIAIDSTLDNATKGIEVAKQSTKDAKIQLDKGIITDKEFKEIKKKNDTTIKTLTKEKDGIKGALEKDYRLAMDKIKEGGNPTGFTKALDSEWAAIKKVFGSDPAKAGKVWTNYIMARELIAGGEMADEVLAVLAKEGENLTGELTEEWITKCTNLDQLLARAFTNTEQLCNNGMLREIYRDKLVKLSAGIRLTEDNANKVKSLINTSLFAEEGMTLSDVMLDNRAYRSMKNLGYKVTEKDGERIINDLQRVAKSFSEDILGEGDVVIKIAGQDMKPQDVVQLIYAVTGDRNIIKLLASKNFSDTAVLSIATQKLLGNNELAREGIINLFKKGKEGSKVTNVRGVFFRALTGMEVPDGAKVGFFNYRSGLYTKDELSDSKAKLYDLITEKNKLRVEGDFQGDFTKTWEYSQENVEKLAQEITSNLKGGFLVVNDARWGDNPLLRDAVNKLKKDGDLTILYPKGGQLSSFVWEGDNLYFKTVDDRLYDDVAGTISIQSLGEAKPTREMLASAYEAQTGRNGDRLRYQASYNDGGVDSLGRQISDQQVEHFSKVHSEMRDENGNLKSAFHGTTKPGFKIFDSRAGDSRFGDYKFGDVNAVYFTSSKENAITYTDIGVEEDGNVIECYLDIRNPYIVDGKGEARLRMEDENAKKAFRKEYNRIKKKWGNNVKIADHIEELNEDLKLFNYELEKNDEGYYDFIYKGDNTKFGQRHIVSYSLDDTNELFEYGGDYLKVDKSTRFDTDSIVRYVLMQNARGANYDGIIFKNIRDTGPKGSILEQELVDDYVIFNSNQAKVIDNRIPTADPNMHFMAREGVTAEEKRLDEMIGADGDSFGRYVKEFVYKDLNNSRIGDIIDIKTLDVDYDKFDKLSQRDQVKILNRLGVRGYLREYDIYRNVPWVQASRDVFSELFDHILSKDGGVLSVFSHNFDDGPYLAQFVNSITDGGFLPYEFDVITDGDYKVIRSTMGMANLVTTSDELRNVGKKYFHNHPNGTYFSSEDIDTFKYMLNINPQLESFGLILPGGIIFDFPVNRINDIEKYAGFHFDGPEEMIETLFELSKDMGNFEFQERGIYKNIIENFSKKWKLNKGLLLSEDKDLIKKVNELNNSIYEKIRKALTPEGAPIPVWMRRLGQYSDQPDMPITDALKVQMFTKDRTVADIANGYGFPIEYIHNTDLIQGVKAYGAYGNGVIYFTDIVKESTPPHELFHGIFNMYVKGQDSDMYERVLRESSELFGVSEYKAEEILADSFAEWFRTGEFTYGEKLKKEAEEILSKEGKIKKKGLNKEQKSLVAQILEYFKEIARQLGILDNHRAEVRQMFEDMVNMKYLPDAGKPVSPENALVKYNKELNDAAVNYFGKMLGLDETDPQYVRNVETKLADMLGIDLQAFNSFTDKASLYRRIDKQLGLERLTTGNFDREMVDVGAVRNEINNLSDEDLDKQIREKLGVLVDGGTIKGSPDIALIREAWFNYNTAEDMSQLLSAEGSIISLSKGVSPATLSLDDLKTLFKDKDALKKRYKDMFFPEQEVSDKDLDRFVKQINGDIYDGLSIQFAENLVKEGYDLPLVNVKTTMYDYLNGTLDLNSDFARAFMYKNNIAMTSDNLNAIVEGALPKEFKFDFNTFENKLADDSFQGDISRVIKRKNEFLPDSYTALSAIEGARAGVTLGGAEYEVLKGTIDKYVKAMKDGVKNKNFTFKDAQKLKQDFSYAMDTFEQEIILPKYSKFLTPEERQSILGIKYTAPIGVGGQSILEVERMLDNWSNRILGWTEVGPNGERIVHKGSYQTTMSQMASENDINAAIAKGYDGDNLDKSTIDRIERRRNQLISNGSTIKEVNGNFIVYDVKESLWQTVNTLPANIEGTAGILALGREGIENLTNKQAYVLLRYLEAAKALSTTSNYTTQLMYKQTPLLAQYSFFTTYAVDASTGLPRVMGNNSLASDDFFTNILSSNMMDQEIKQDVFADVIKAFRKNGYVEEGELSKMIDNAISRQINELGRLNALPLKEQEIAKGKMKNIYTNMFIPYSYLRDLPVGGGIRQKLESTIKEAYNQAIKDLGAAGASDTDDIQKMIIIRMDDGESKSLDELADVKIDDWKKAIFNDDTILVRGADEVEEGGSWRFLKSEEQLTKEQQAVRENIQNQYAATLKAIENESQIISDAERELMVSFMSDVRTDLRKYSLTSKMVDALDAVSGMGEEVSRGMKNYIIGLRGMRTYGKFRTADIWARYDKVKEAYRAFYNMPLETLIKAKPRDAAEEVARNAARYFKNLERLLGSVDGKTGVSTSEAINKAFYHIGETFMNLGVNGATETSGVRGLFGMLSGIEQNQVLKFFKFSNPGQDSYVKMFKQAHRSDGKLLEAVGGYRDYVETINNITKEEFNRIFGTNYTDKEFKRVLQGLTGFTLSGGGLARRINKILDVANSSRMAFRMLMSYPGQLLTIPQQGVAYFLKQIGYEAELGIIDMGRIDAIRESFGVLDGAYNELPILGKLYFNPDSLDKNAFYNRYGIPTMKDLYEDTGISTADDYVNMYAKIDKKYSKPGKIANAVKRFDPYKDNANNFIDGIFARNFKNIAFVKGLRDNNYMKFASAEDFLEFMNDATISAEVKSRLMDAVAAASGRNFRNILGLGFGGLDRPIGAAGWQNILYGLMQMLNFRGSWGQNIFKQTGTAFWNLYKATLGLPGLSKEAREKLIDYLGNSPEFVNFVTAMLQDLEWSFKLTRYQDNGRWPDEDEDPRYYFLDYLSYIRETMNMTSQRYQGIQSFGPMRPFIEMNTSRLQSMMDPTIYHDTWGVGAFFNALGKNFGRQWKPVNWLIEAAGAFESGERANLKAYLNSQLFNLSFGSLRYMVNEDENSYGYTYEVTGQVGGIPSIAMGEAQIGSDKSFMYDLDNSETWKSMQLIADDDVAWEDKKKYWGNLRKAFVNGSQLFKTIKNFNKVRKGEYSKSFFSSEDLAGIIQQTPAGRQFYDKGYVIPSTNEEAVIFIKTILNNSEYRPGSKQFNKSLLQFEDFGHMDAAKGNAADAQMELWLEHMKYKTNEHGEFVKKNGERVVDENWNKLITNVKQYYSNEEYVANVIYNYSKDWLDEHSSDPNYPLYLKMLGQGNANMLIDSELNRIKATRNKGVKGDLKWTDANLNAAEYRDMILRMGNSILDGDDITFFEKLNRLDEDDATLAALKIIYDQSTELGRTDIEKFFDIETSKEDDTIVEDVKLKPQYESALRQIGRISRAIDKGNEESVLATMSSLVNQFKNDDPTGEITAMLINSTYDRIYEAKNLSPRMKNEMMIGLFYDNKDFIQRNPEKLRELLGDAYDDYAKAMNEMLYKWDGQIISNMEDLVARNEENTKIISGALKKGSAASRAIKTAAMNLSGIGGNGIGGGKYATGQRAGQGYGQRVPVKIKGADLVKELKMKGYNPTNVVGIVFKYTPHADFSLAKDVNRNVKGPKTQAVSKKKQLSKLESDTEKALEAES